MHRYATTGAMFLRVTSVVRRPVRLPDTSGLFAASRFRPRREFQTSRAQYLPHAKSTRRSSPMHAAR